MRNELIRIRGLATDILLMADNFAAGFAVDALGEMAEEIVEMSSKLLKDVIEVERAEIMAEHVRCV
jgi:hypothetical protein